MRARIPPLVLIFFSVNLLLVLAYVIDYLGGRPYRPLTAFLDLNGECNLPTWYASVQWLGVATLLGIFAWRNVERTTRRSWVLAVLPLIFLAFSLDEVAQIHEWAGKRGDALLVGDRAQTVFSRTGTWMFVLGIPAVVLTAAFVILARGYFRRAPGAFSKAVLGIAIVFSGAVGIEMLRNFVAPNTAFDVAQVVLEELCEMTGATLLLWAGYELLREEGVSLARETAARRAAASLQPRFGARVPRT